jgi:hypothetical protein
VDYSSVCATCSKYLRMSSAAGFVMFFSFQEKEGKKMLVTDKIIPLHLPREGRTVVDNRDGLVAR